MNIIELGILSSINYFFFIAYIGEKFSSPARTKTGDFPPCILIKKPRTMSRMIEDFSLCFAVRAELYCTSCPHLFYKLLCIPPFPQIEGFTLRVTFIRTKSEIISGLETETRPENYL